MPTATYYSHHDDEPTDGHPWPRARVTVTATGDCEYWWPTGTTFPVQLDRTPGLCRDYTTSQISVDSATSTSTSTDTSTPAGNDSADLDLVHIPAQPTAHTRRPTQTRAEPIPEPTT